MATPLLSSFVVPPALFAHSAFPETSYFTRKMSKDPVLLLRVYDPKDMIDDLKPPVK